MAERFESGCTSNDSEGYEDDECNVSEGSDGSGQENHPMQLNDVV